MPSFVAISSSVGARPSRASSSAIARSISRARARTERGTQSIARSSSMIEPRIRAIAYVSNLLSRSGSKRSIAPMSPSRPYETRSPSSTCAGARAEPPGDVLHERRVLRISWSRTALPSSGRYWRHSVPVSSLLLLALGHRGRIRRAGEDSSARQAAEGPSWRASPTAPRPRRRSAKTPSPKRSRPRSRRVRASRARKRTPRARRCDTGRA